MRHMKRTFTNKNEHALKLWKRYLNAVICFFPSPLFSFKSDKACIRILLKLSGKYFFLAVSKSRRLLMWILWIHDRHSTIIDGLCTHPGICPYVHTIFLVCCSQHRTQCQAHFIEEIIISIADPVFNKETKQLFPTKQVHLQVCW